MKIKFKSNEYKSVKLQDIKGGEAFVLGHFNQSTGGKNYTTYMRTQEKAVNDRIVAVKLQDGTVVDFSSDREVTKIKCVLVALES